MSINRWIPGLMNRFLNMALFICCTNLYVQFLCQCVKTTTPFKNVFCNVSMKRRNFIIFITFTSEAIFLFYNVVSYVSSNQTVLEGAYWPKLMWLQD